MTSDWNYLWIPHPDPTADRVAMGVDVYANTPSVAINFMPLVDGPAYIPDTYVRNGIGFGNTSAYYTIAYAGSTAGTYSAMVSSSVWTTVRQDVDLIDGTTTVYKNGVMVGAWAINTAAAVGSNLMINSGVPHSGSHCFKNLNVYASL